MQPDRLGLGLLYICNLDQRERAPWIGHRATALGCLEPLLAHKSPHHRHETPIPAPASGRRDLWWVASGPRGLVSGAIGPSTHTTMLPVPCAGQPVPHDNPSGAPTSLGGPPAHSRMVMRPWSCRAYRQLHFGLPKVPAVLHPCTFGARPPSLYTAATRQ